MLTFSIAQAALLFFAGLFAGALNSVAGGGGFIAFPALLAVGVPPIPANASQTFSLWPGALASTMAYRREFTAENRRILWPLFVMSFFGAIIGALLLLKTPERTFTRLIPWLMLTATLLFTFSGPVSQWVRSKAQREVRTHAPGTPHPPPRRGIMIAALLLQMAFAIYIGYFGAGAGILILALLAILGMENIHTMNAFKMAIAVTANGMAVVTFIFAKTIVWPQALVMTAGAAVGGYMGAWLAQKIDPQWVRYLVIAVGAMMTLHFFWKY